LLLLLLLLGRPTLRRISEISSAITSRVSTLQAIHFHEKNAILGYPSCV